MTPTQWLVLVIIAVPLFLATTNRLRADVAAIIIALLLGGAQYLGLGVLAASDTPEAASQAFIGFGQPIIVTLIGLFVMVRVLDSTGFTRWFARRVVQVGGTSERRIMLLFTVSAAVLGLFILKVAVVALLLPSAVQTAQRANIKVSKVLIPLAFGSLLGGMATYFTTANIIVDSLLRTVQPPQAPLNILSFTPTGGLIVLMGVAFIAAFGARLLPSHVPLTDQIMARPTGSDLEDAYQLNERLWEATIRPGSPLAERTLAQSGIGKDLGLTVVAIWHRRQAIFSPPADQVLHEQDILLVIGREDRVHQLTNRGLKIGRSSTASNGHISEMGVSFIEMVLAPHSTAAGKTLKQLEFRRKYGFTAVALWRDGRSYRTDVADFPLKPGDSFLLVGPRQNLKKLHTAGQFIALEPNPADKPLERRATVTALLITGIAILIAALGFPVGLAMLGGALLMVMLRLINMEDAYRAVEWQVIFSVAAMYAVSVAMVESGLAGLVGQLLVDVVGPLGSLGLAAGAFWFSALLTHIMGGQVTAYVTAPITISAALTLNTSPQAIAVATAIGCTAAFLTPLAHPVNLLVVGPGNYRNADFVRLGIPVLLITFIGTLIGMVLFWGL